MKIKGAVLAAITLATLVACQAEESEEECKWELGHVTAVAAIAPRPPAPRPAPAPRPPVVKVPGAKPPAKMPTVKPPKPSSKAPAGQRWVYDCD